MSAAARTPSSRLRPIDLFVPVGSLLLLAAMVGLVLSTAGPTFGYDFDAYIRAAHRLAEGLPLYDQSVSAAGGHAVYLYPPPFAVALLPLLTLPDAWARAVWCVGMACCLPLGAYLLPVKRDIRWLVIIIAALNWPFLYGVKLGQVGPLLFLVFALGWRWLDRGLSLGSSIAVGALVKLQPVLLIGWAVATRRYRAAAAAVGVSIAVIVVATLVTGVGAWSDYLTLLTRVSSAATTPRNTSPAAIAYGAGLSLELAGAIQVLSTVVVCAAMVAAWRFARPETSLMVTILASQLITPLLWNHYAVLLLLPMAWLADRGRMWVVVLPLLDWIALGSDDSWVYGSIIPVTFFAFLALVLVEANRDRHLRPEAGRSQSGSR